LETDDPTARVRGACTAAVLAKDVDAVIALYHADVRVFDLWGRWSYVGREAFRGTVADWFESLGNERVMVEWQDVRTPGSWDIAVLHAFARYTALSADGADRHRDIEGHARARGACVDGAINGGSSGRGIRHENPPG